MLYWNLLRIKFKIKIIYPKAIIVQLSGCVCVWGTASDTGFGSKFLCQKVHFLTEPLSVILHLVPDLNLDLNAGETLAGPSGPIYMCVECGRRAQYCFSFVY